MAEGERREAKSFFLPLSLSLSPSPCRAAALAFSLSHAWPLRLDAQRELD